MAPGVTPLTVMTGFSASTLRLLTVALAELSAALAAVVGAPLMVGTVLSSLTVTESVPRLPARSLAWPLTTWPAAVVSALTTWSGVTVAGSTPEPRASSLASKWTVVVALFQPAALAAGVSVWVTVGAMLSYFSATWFGASLLPA